MNKIIDFSVKNHVLVLVITAITTFFFGYYYLNQSYSNSIKVFFNDDSPDIEYYEKFQSKYGNDETLLITFSADDIFSVEKIKLIRKLTKAVDSVDGISRVVSITSAEVIQGDGDTLSYEPLLPDDVLITQNVVNNLKKRVVTSKKLKNTVISENLKTTALLVELHPVFSNFKKGEIINKLKDATVKAADGSVNLHYAGSPCVDVKINELTNKDNLKFTPITFLIIFFIVLWMLRNISLSILAQVNIVVIVVCSIGLLILCGEVINSVTVVIAPIILAISIADSIHILAHYKKLYVNNSGQHLKASADAAKSLWVPCLFTSLTTGIGYFSFLVSDVKPVKTVGLFTGIGVMIAFFMSVIFLPALLVAAGKIIKKSNIRESKGKDLSSQKFYYFLEKLGGFVVDKYKIIGLISLILTIFVASGIFKIRYETDFATYLKEDNPVKKDLLYVEKNLSGTVPVELIIKAKSPDNFFTNPKSVKLIDKIQNDILNHMKNRYTSSFSISDLLKESNKAFNSDNEDMYILPDDEFDIIDYYEFADRDILSRILSLDKAEARITFSSYFASTNQAKEVEKFIGSHVKNLLGDDFTYKFTGLSALYVQMDRNLKSSQIKSFGTAFVLIFIMMFFVCKNVKLTIISMIPNIFPIAVTLGIMGWFDIPLDVSTIMIASVTIGIAVDDTIHFITWFRRNSLEMMDTKTAIVKTFIDTGKPIIMTSIVLSSAYFVLLTGSVKPIISFGALAGLAMIFALIGDLFILPAVILIFKPEFNTAEDLSISNEAVPEV